MGYCDICHNDSVGANGCVNCGKVFGSFQSVLLKSVHYFYIIVTDKYLVFKDAYSMNGVMMSSFAGGLIGSTIYEAAKDKQREKKFGMIDIGSVSGAVVYFPESKAQGGLLHLFFKNGKDLVIGIFEAGMKKVNLPLAINALAAAGIDPQINYVKSLPRLKMNDPFVTKTKDLLVTVSRSATAFIPPFKGMIVID